MSYCYNYPQGTHDLIFINANPTLVDFSRVTISVTKSGHTAFDELMKRVYEEASNKKLRYLDDTSESEWGYIK